MGLLEVGEDTLFSCPATRLGKESELQHGIQQVRGKLFVTSFRVLFLSSEDYGSYDLAAEIENFSCDDAQHLSGDSVPKICVHTVQTSSLPNTRLGDGRALLLLTLETKDARVLTFVTQQAYALRVRELVAAVIASPAKHAFAFVAAAATGLEIDQGDDRAFEAWTSYDPVEEFIRQGVLPTHVPTTFRSRRNQRWRVSSANTDYALCPSYPQRIVVPAAISDSQLAEAAKFRLKGRLPVLCWQHPFTGGALARAAQPKAMKMLVSKRSAADEELVSAIFRSAVPTRQLSRGRHAYGAVHVGSTVGFYKRKRSVIVDARPAMNARANALGGRGGTESSEHYAGGTYEGCEVVFAGIDNIYEMQRSYKALIKICAEGQSSGPRNRDWLTALHSTRWLDHISIILASARFIAFVVGGVGSDSLDAIGSMSPGHHGVSRGNGERAPAASGGQGGRSGASSGGGTVLVHCSDGWDRTPQLTSLAMLLLDPFYRTLDGFAVLVEKEWLSFGHCFAVRCGHDADLRKSRRKWSPVFVQWMDCVWQVVRQFPTHFEFNERFLVAIIDTIYSCRYGNFLGNSQRQRLRERLHQRTGEGLWVSLLGKSSLDKKRIPFRQPPGVYGAHLFSRESSDRPVSHEELIAATTTRSTASVHVLVPTDDALALSHISSNQRDFHDRVQTNSHRVRLFCLSSTQNVSRCGKDTGFVLISRVFPCKANSTKLTERHSPH